MDKQLDRDALIQRIAALEAKLLFQRDNSKTKCGSNAFDLADFENAADGICVCHAIEDIPYVKFTFWNKRMVDLTGYRIGEINLKGWYQSVYPDPEVQAKAISRMEQMRQGINMEAENWEITRSDGQQRTLRISTSMLDHDDGQARVMAIMHDVTELKNHHTALSKERQDLKRELAKRSISLADIDRALKASEAKYRNLFEKAGDALIIHDLTGNILDANKKALALLGYTLPELSTIKIPMLHPPETLEKSKKAFKTIIRDGSVQFEIDFISKNGAVIPTEVSSSIFEIEGQKVIQGIIRDIRKRKLAEQARRDTFDIIEKSPVAAFLWRNETDWPVEFVTRNVERIFGYSAADFSSGRVRYSGVVHPEDLKRVAHEVATHSQESHRKAFIHAPYRIVAQDGTIRWVNDHTFIRRDHNGVVTHYQGIVEDITTRLAAEQALRESKEKFTRIFQLNPDTVIITRLKDGVILDVNDSFINATGYSREEVIGHDSVEDLRLWADPLERYQYVKAILRKGTARDMELRFRIKTGEIRLGSVCGALIEISGERCFIGTIRDITEERQAANQLLEEKERLSVTLRSIGDAVITTDRKGRIALMNPIAENLTGWKESEAIQKRLIDVFHIVNERTGEPCTSPVDKVLSTGKNAELANHTMLIAKTGQHFIIADSGAPILDAKGEIIGVVLVFRDITGQQRIEKELAKMEKLKSLGVLAGGIAHDFNNFLTGIIGNLSLAKLDSPPGNPVSRALEDMEKAAMRAKALTQQLLTFSKGGKPVRHTIGIEAVVGESTQFALRGSNVCCKLIFDKGRLVADVDEGQFSQVVHNIVINADQAMPNGGTIVIQGAEVILPPNNPYALEPGKHIQLSFQDEGVGIQSDHIKKIFDPYFTTKQKGSGLGLAVAYSIIVKHGGQLTVDSTLGEGTTVTLHLPASEGAQVIDTKDHQGPISGHGRILVMDDEEFIRKLAAVMLAKMGYEVTLAKDGQAAVNIYKEGIEIGKTYDAVILDLTVPGGLGGKESLQQLTALDPNVRAIVCSGYSNDPVLADHARHGFCGAVKKPYQIEELSQILDAVLKG